MGRDSAQLARLPRWQGEEPGLPQRRPHHILNHPHPERATATREGGIVPAGAIKPRPPHPTEERMVVMGVT